MGGLSDYQLDYIGLVICLNGETFIGVQYDSTTGNIQEYDTVVPDARVTFSNHYDYARGESNILVSVLITHSVTFPSKIPFPVTSNNVWKYHWPQTSILDQRRESRVHQYWLDLKYWVTLL